MAFLFKKLIQKQQSYLLKNEVNVNTEKKKSVVETTNKSVKQIDSANVEKTGNGMNNEVKIKTPTEDNKTVEEEKISSNDTDNSTNTSQKSKDYNDGIITIGTTVVLAIAAGIVYAYASAASAAIAATVALVEAAEIATWVLGGLTAGGTDDEVALATGAATSSVYAS